MVESPGGSLADLLQASHWRIETSTPRAELEAGVAAFLAADEVLVERMTKKGVRSFDCRAAVVRLAVVEDDAGTPQLDLVLRHAVPAVRPDDVLTGLRATSGVEPGESPRLTRLAQGPFDEASSTVGDPLAPTVA